MNDLGSRLLLKKMSWMYGSTNATPLLCTPPINATSEQSETVHRITLDCLPVPDVTCSWEEIIDFKNEHAQKEWGLRRFLRSLTTEVVSEAEVRDNIEWSINEYRQAMALHKMKENLSRLETYVVLPIEIAEHLVKFNWATLAKGIISVRKRRIEEVEAKQKAPGRECAYVVYAQDHFDKRKETV